MAFFDTSSTLAQLAMNGFATLSIGGGVNYIEFARHRDALPSRERHPRSNALHEFGFHFSYDAAGREVKPKRS